MMMMMMMMIDDNDSGNRYVFRLLENRFCQIPHEKNAEAKLRVFHTR